MFFVVVPALHFVWVIYTLQRRLVHASLHKEIRQEEVLSCFLCIVLLPAFNSFHIIFLALLVTPSKDEFETVSRKELIITNVIKDY